MVKNTSIGTWLAIAFAFSTNSAAYPCKPNNTQASVSIKQQVDEVVSHLVGSMNTSAQAKANPNAPDVRMTTCKVKVLSETLEPKALNPDSVFLYQEQAISRNLSKPYRQRFLQITPNSDRLGVESAGFKPPTPEAWVGFCNQPEAKRIVQISDIGKTECSVFLQRQEDKYIGETQGGGCPSNYKGAVRITNRIVLHQAGMDTLDRGLDAAGNVIWGAKEEPYQFRWINYSTPAR
ncbi:MAG: chromophore lyase CpcT/CpeT [Aphanothece sp. CMT-3BRIN-NPC111]|jgi:hypothetical protein|nr:chromophore lyase CpcT/CpeT [Aphanothece sp. CMT-3BRIN-NPC111]